MCPVCLVTVGLYVADEAIGKAAIHPKEGGKSDDEAHDRDT